MRWIIESNDANKESNIDTKKQPLIASSPVKLKPCSLIMGSDSGTVMNQEQIFAKYPAMVKSSLSVYAFTW